MGMERGELGLVEAEENGKMPEKTGSQGKFLSAFVRRLERERLRDQGSQIKAHQSL
ncbi:hypothetical protein TIFTF001_046041 [Ficus carica]|uniref:Uncharacterized protein n=1 Tax=Ficus carica TaxID=3494 RepID=A0AA88CQQ4_FICCA|nr:hypothetical protein TIFTF001_046038 [Ficus carica]GMN26257.1 hypothetical protein TIFTF001_046039 [Ficus carica]GMN26272.1 hypothetical protein TIFTF001_046040 [Ficus carica]GMN26285.1 hypothetical protein TIFTF001_046041 [Ficus carica]